MKICFQIISVESVWTNTWHPQKRKRKKKRVSKSKPPHSETTRRKKWALCDLIQGGTHLQLASKIKT